MIRCPASTWVDPSRISQIACNVRLSILAVESGSNILLGGGGQAIGRDGTSCQSFN